MNLRREYNIGRNMCFLEAKVLTGRQDAETEYLGQEIDGIDDMDEEEEKLYIVHIFVSTP